MRARLATLGHIVRQRLVTVVHTTVVEMAFAENGCRDLCAVAIRDITAIGVRSIAILAVQIHAIIRVSA